MQKLAVSIPAYKRPALLLRNLQHLAPQCLSNSIEIHIFDDSCTDINQAVYDQITAKWKCLKVYNNPRNLGIDRNIDQCISVPRSDYVWMIGEDDLVSDGAIGAILERLENRPEYLFVNYQYISNDYSKLLRVAVNDLGAESSTAGDFFSRHGWATGFLGANVVNRSRWDIESTEYMGTYFNHVGKIFSQLAPSDRVEAITQPLVYNRAESLDSFTWLNDCFEVNAGFGNMIRTLSLKDSDWEPDATRALYGFQHKIDFRNFKSLLVLRALGIFDLKKYNTYVSDLPWWPFYALIAVMPVPMLKMLYNIYKALRTRSARHDQ
jgi:glycosyltransferase involved in cell wall biosynthesis